jgi:hypothetical protein
MAQFYNGQFSLAAFDCAKAQQLEPSAYMAISLYLARAGAKTATAELAANAKSFKPEGWPAPVFPLMMDEIDGKTLRSVKAALAVRPRCGIDRRYFRRRA